MKPIVMPSQLISSRLLIRPLRNGDEFLLNCAIVDSFVQLHEWTEWAIKPPTMEETRAYVEFSLKCWSEEKSVELPFLIFDPSTDNLIGAASFHAINWKIPSFEIGYWGNIHYSGQGLITEAVNILIHHAFSAWNAQRIEIRCDPENRKSAAIPERLGFLLEAQFKNHRIHPGSQKISGTSVFVRYDLEGLPEVKYTKEIMASL